MKLVKLIVFVLVVSVAFLACNEKVVEKDMKTDSDLKMLAEYMSGEFSSKAQSEADSNFYNITLKMKPVFKTEKNAYWLYVEQAVAAMQERPYRQRVYKIEKLGDHIFASTIYKFKTDPKKYAGEWKKETPLETLTPDSIETTPGMTIFLIKREDDTFGGSTAGKECKNSWNGASYATAHVQIFPNKLISWDRGYDKDDNFIWGPENGGYIFDKEKGFGL